jgi:hypothetical protein
VQIALAELLLLPRENKRFTSYVAIHGIYGRHRLDGDSGGGGAWCRREVCVTYFYHIFTGWPWARMRWGRRSGSTAVEEKYKQHGEGYDQC